MRIQSVQSSKFHGRNQFATETVDHYVQDLKKLLLWAYPLTQREAAGVDTMAQSVLAYQYVDGLKTEIRWKLAEVEGTFDQLLSKARFEEARLRDVAQAEKTAGQTKPGGSGGPKQNHTSMSSTQGESAHPKQRS